MAKIVRLTEQDLVRLVNKVIKEQNQYPNHQGIKYLAEKLKPFGFQLDTEHFGGVPTVIKGDDRNGAAIQFYTKNGFYFQLVVTVNGKDVVLKKYPINEKDNYTSNKAVNQILIDLEKWKNYNFQKSKNLGEQSGIVNKVIKEQNQKSFVNDVNKIPCIKNNFVFRVYKVTDRQILSKFQGKVSGTPVLTDKNVIIFNMSKGVTPEKATIIANGNPVGTFDLNGTSLQDEIDTITFAVYVAQPDKSKFKIGWVLCNDGLYLYDIYGEQQRKLGKI